MADPSNYDRVSEPSGMSFDLQDITNPVRSESDIVDASDGTAFESLPSTKEDIARHALSQVSFQGSPSSPRTTATTAAYGDCDLPQPSYAGSPLANPTTAISRTMASPMAAPTNSNNPPPTPIAAGIATVTGATGTSSPYNRISASPYTQSRTYDTSFAPSSALPPPPTSQPLQPTTTFTTHPYQPTNVPFTTSAVSGQTANPGAGPATPSNRRDGSLQSFPWHDDKVWKIVLSRWVLAFLLVFLTFALCVIINPPFAYASQKQTVDISPGVPQQAAAVPSASFTTAGVLAGAVGALYIGIMYLTDPRKTAQ